MCRGRGEWGGHAVWKHKSAMMHGLAHLGIARRFSSIAEPDAEFGKVGGIRRQSYSVRICLSVEDRTNLHGEAREISLREGIDRVVGLNQMLNRTDRDDTSPALGPSRVPLI